METSKQKNKAFLKLDLLGDLFESTEALSAGLNRNALKRLTDTGKLERLGEGVYKKVESTFDLALEDFAVACIKLGPDSYITGPSALSFHNLINFTPKTLWIAATENKRSKNYRVIRCTKEPNMEGVLVVEKFVRIAGVERAIVDAFYLSTKISLQHAIYAAHSAFESNITTPAKVLELARKIGLENVILKHWEAINLDKFQ
jgi:predicted transcriptional regulator of viral defense system